MKLPLLTQALCTRLLDSNESTEWYLEPRPSAGVQSMGRVEVLQAGEGVTITRAIDPCGQSLNNGNPDTAFGLYCMISEYSFCRLDTVCTVLRIKAVSDSRRKARTYLCPQP